MSREEPRDCFEDCANYARCFEMACETDSLAENLLLRYVMDIADKRRRECDEGRCAILGTARMISENYQNAQPHVAAAARRCYDCLLDSDKLLKLA